MKAPDRKVIEVPGLSDNVRRQGLPLSMAVAANGFVFVSGVGPMNPDTGDILRGDIEEQTAAALRVVQRVLETAGSALDRIVSARIYVTNAGHYDAVNRVYASFFPADPPARTFVTVGSWFASFDIEIEVVALEGRG